MPEAPWSIRYEGVRCCCAALCADNRREAEFPELAVTAACTADGLG